MNYYRLNFSDSPASTKRSLSKRNHDREYPALTIKSPETGCRSAGMDNPFPRRYRSDQINRKIWSGS